MREIKFRAWDGKTMIYLPIAGLQYFDFEGSYVLSFAVDGYDGFWAHEHYDTVSKKASKFPIMQFTGLHDCKGVEIYEGDVIKQRGWRNTFVEYVRGRWVLRYDEKNVEWRQNLHDKNLLHIEVIGNIYSNPELIK